jgi:two-component system sensor histidine kinase VicK
VSSLTDDFFIGEEFQLFFEKSPQSMVVKANIPYWTILAASDQFLKITHRQRRELIGQNLFDVFPGNLNDSSEMLSSFEKFKETIETKARVDWPTFRYEIWNPIIGEMEVEYWSNFNEPLLDEVDNVIYIINTTTNITAQVNETAAKEHAQERLRVSEKNFQYMIQQAPVGMCILKGDPLYVEEVNDLFLEIIGKRREQFIDAPYWEVIAEVADFYSPITDNVIKTGTPYRAKEHEVMLIRNGREEVVHINFVCVPMKDIDGSVNGIMIIGIDVTDQITDRRELERAYEQVRLSKQAAQLGTFDMDLVKGSFELDERARSLFGIHHQDEVTYEKDFIAGLHPEDRERVTGVIKRVFNKAASNGDYDVEFRTVSAEDEKVRWVRAKGKAYFDEWDRPVRFIGSMLDITEQKSDEIRKNDFIGMVSHELKTPLTSLTAVTQMLNAKFKNSKDHFVANALDMAITQVKKMGKMINGFLDVSRLESGKIIVTKQYFELSDLIKEVIKEAGLTTSFHNIDYEAGKKIIICADRDKIGSVISNLLSNAVKYSPKGKLIIVDSEIREENVRVSVKDQGMGMKRHDMDRLFERYYRVETSHTRYISGFGIGLYLCAEIIKRHNGKIGVESESGVGSTFYFTLPLT